jgi:hypothetical protein
VLACVSKKVMSCKHNSAGWDGSSTGVQGHSQEHDSTGWDSNSTGVQGHSKSQEQLAAQ